MKKEIKKVFEYQGFESWIDMSRDMNELFDYAPFNRIPGEGTGVLKITVEYLEKDN